MIGSTFLALAAFLAADDPAPPLLEVAVATREVERRDGQTVRVRGWIDDRCYELGCVLLARPRGSGDNSMAKLSIGYDPDVEPILLAHRGRQVIVEGVLDASCRRHICIDRAPDFRPLRIVRVIEAGSVKQ